MTTVAGRAVGAVVGGLVADAAALPLHWIYDGAKVAEVVGDRTDPEFMPSSHCPFYHIPTGRNSCYGHQAYVLLESLTHCKGFDKADYKKRLYEAMGPQSEYEGTLGRPTTRQDMPVSFPWRNGSIKKFIENYEAGNEETGADDSQADGFAKMAAVAALYAGRPEMEAVVKEVVAVTQNNEEAIAAAVAGAKVLEQYILNGPSPDVLSTVAKGVSGTFASHMSEAIDMKDKDHKETVKEFGSSCALPGSFKGVIHCLAKSDGDYVNTVRMNMIASGDNCSRLCLIGAALGAQVGIGNIPAEWISKTNVGTKTKELAEELVACRPS